MYGVMLRAKIEKFVKEPPGNASKKIKAQKTRAALFSGPFFFTQIFYNLMREKFTLSEYDNLEHRKEADNMANDLDDLIFSWESENQSDR